MRYAAMLGLCASAVWAAGGKPAPAGKQQNDTVAVEATLYADKAAVKELLGSDLGGFYVVVAVKVIPRLGRELPVSRDDFTLRTDRDGEKTTPFAASQIAGAGALVVGQRGGGGGVMADQGGPVWGGYPGGGIGRIGGNGGSMGNVGQSEAEATVRTGGKEKDDPIRATLEQKILPEKTSADPVSGLLYFPMEAKQKVKDLELIYKTPEGKLFLRFR